MGDGLKFTIRYQRKLQTRPYENMTIGLEMDFDIDYNVDEAFKQIMQIVEQQIHDALNGARK